MAVDRVVDELCQVLDEHGPLHHRVIETRLAARDVPVPVARLALKIAWERGTLAYLNATTAWNREVRVFALTASAYPGLNLLLSRERAVTALVTAYFDRYGPATIRDAVWWSGLSATDITTALARSGRELLRVVTPWADDPCWMFADRLEEFRAGERAETGVQLLAHEDTALKAYFQTRSRYLVGLPQRRAFNRIGEALPTVLVNGRVVGTWSWRPPTRSVRTSLVRGRLTSAERRQVKTRTEALTEVLRHGWTPHPVRSPLTSGSSPFFPDRPGGTVVGC